MEKEFIRLHCYKWIPFQPHDVAKVYGFRTINAETVGLLCTSVKDPSPRAYRLQGAAKADFVRQADERYGTRSVASDTPIATVVTSDEKTFFDKVYTISSVRWG